MNELQIWFKGNEEHDSWIYFKTKEKSIIAAIKDFQLKTMKAGIDFADMIPVQYGFWDSEKNYIDGFSVNKLKDMLDWK